MTDIYEVEIITDQHFYSLEEICLGTQLKHEFITSCVNYGIIDVDIEDSITSDWKFSSLSVERIQRAFRLQRDLDINFSGLGVIFHLLENIKDLEEQQETLQRRLKLWESDDSR